MLLGMHARKQAGKDTAYQRLVELYPDKTVERVSFADLLYKSAAAAIGVSVQDLNAWKTDGNVRLEVYRYQNKKGPRGGRRMHVFNVRQYLQWYGTEAHREVFGTDFWVDAVELTNHEDKIVVVTDVRFVNEAEAIRAAGGHIVQILGPAEVEQNGDSHASEVPLDEELVTFVVDNSDRTTFDKLDSQLRAVVEGLVPEKA